MHTRTYADPRVTRHQDSFVWVIVDPSVSSANEALVEEYTEKIQTDLNEFLSFPTAIFMNSEGKLLKAAVGMWEPQEMEKLIGEVLTLAGKKESGK